MRENLEETVKAAIRLEQERLVMICTMSFLVTYVVFDRYPEMLNHVFEKEERIKYVDELRKMRGKIPDLMKQLIKTNNILVEEIFNAKDSTEPKDPANFDA